MSEYGGYNVGMQTGNFESLYVEAMRLPLEQRTELAARLTESVHPPMDTGIEAAWVEECQRRWEAYKRGEMEVIEGEEIIRTLELGGRP